VSGIASSRSPGERFYCLGRNRGLILKFRKVEITFFLKDPQSKWLIFTL
jgi:hypothetical protein